MTDYDYDDMLDRVQRDFALPPDELVHVKTQLTNDSAGADRYLLLEILGMSMDTSAVELVESFLVRPEDPMLSRLALQILCNYWGRGGDYLAYIEEFLEGVDWDVHGHVRMMAFSCAGTYLAGHDHERLLRLLTERAEQGPDGPEEVSANLFWDAAMHALGSAVGYSSRELPGVTGFDPDGEWTAEILRRARQRLGEDTDDGTMGQR